MRIHYFISLILMSKLCAGSLDPVFLEQVRGDFDQEITALIQRTEPVERFSFENRADAILTMKKQGSIFESQVRASFQSRSGHLPAITNIWLADTLIVKAPARIWKSFLESRPQIKITANHPVDFIKPIEETSMQGNINQAVTYGIAKINADKVWRDFGVTGRGIRVGVIDSGYAVHPDLDGKILASQDFTGETSGNEPNDLLGHGTHCMGIIGGGNASGQAIGTAPGVNFIVARIFGKKRATLAIVLSAMQWIVDPDGDPETNDGPHIISNSWGSPAQTYLWEPTLRWKKLGILPIFAAGNQGPRKRTIASPGGYPHLIAVGATDMTDNLGSFSSIGPSFYYRKSYTKPDISAPGVDIFSSYIGGTGYRKWSGTSMATPFVSGTAALVMEANPNLSVYQVEKILLESAIDLGVNGKDNYFGEGRVDAYEAVRRARASTN